MCDQVFDADDLQIVLFGQSSQVVAGGAVAGFVQHLAQNTNGSQPGHAREVDRGFGVSGATQHAAFFGQQRVHVTGTNEVFLGGF